MRTWSAQLPRQARLLGVESVPIGVFRAVFTGIVLALLASYSFTGAIPLYFVGTLVEKTITMELAPVLTGLALAGRVGASIAAELGTMRVTEQIDALETLAYDPVAYLVVPRVLAGAAMFPVVVALEMVAGRIVGAMTVAAAQLRASTARIDMVSMRLERSQLHLESVLARADSVMDKVNAGRGSVGLLVNDAALYRNADSLVVQLRQRVADVKANPKRYVNVKLF